MIVEGEGTLTARGFTRWWRYGEETVAAIFSDGGELAFALPAGVVAITARQRTHRNWA